MRKNRCDDGLRGSGGGDSGRWQDAHGCMDCRTLVVEREEGPKRDYAMHRTSRWFTWGNIRPENFADSSKGWGGMEDSKGARRLVRCEGYTAEDTGISEKATDRSELLSPLLLLPHRKWDVLVFARLPCRDRMRAHDLLHLPVHRRHGL